LKREANKLCGFSYNPKQKTNPLAHKDPEWLKYHATMVDTGPLYTETEFGHVIVEPWNAVTSLAFLIPAIYWLWRVRFDFRRYPILVICGVLLFVGGMGSTLFHAFRSSRALIVMDFLPMGLACLCMSGYFWYRVLYQKWYWVASILVPTLVLRQSLFDWLNHHNAINVSYFLTGTMIFLPLLLRLIQTHWKGLLDVAVALLCFASALFFRQIDAWHPPVISIGTHFLWHLLGAWGSFHLARHLYKAEESNHKSRLNDGELIILG